jgi:hypothetical protein
MKPSPRSLTTDTALGYRSDELADVERRAH